MKTFFGSVAILILATCFTTTRAQAQGPTGAGAAVAAGGGSSNARSYNPVKWFGKKDAKSPESALSQDELDKRLEPKLRSAQILAPAASLKDVCANFIERFDCLAALHATRSLGLNFACVASNVSGVRVGTDTSGCRMPEGDKPLSLLKTIRLLKPDADAKSAAKAAETTAREDIQDAVAQPDTVQSALK
ncbi:MAG TPA: hypothetical protein VLC94_10450 [Candidatus Acidoferrum sp.]|nr:hypothetical protein [Candidatus Acidoferrum sp.]